MRLATHLRAARTTRGLTPATAGLITGIGSTGLTQLEAGDRLPRLGELEAIAATYVIDSPTIFLLMVTELVELLVEHDHGLPHRQDEDLYELLDVMVRFLAERGRL